MRLPRQVDETSVMAVQDRQFERSEVDIPAVSISLLQSDQFPGQGFAEIDMGALPADIPLGFDPATVHLVGIDRLGSDQWVRTGRRLIVLGRGSVAQGLMWSLVIVLSPEGVEGELLFAPGRLWW